jgi:hypothetical protein
MRSSDRLSMSFLTKQELSLATLWSLKSFLLELILMGQISNLKSLKKRMFVFTTLNSSNTFKIKILKITVI